MCLDVALTPNTNRIFALSLRVIRLDFQVHGWKGLVANREFTFLSMAARSDKNNTTVWYVIIPTIPTLWEHAKAFSTLCPFCNVASQLYVMLPSVSYSPIALRLEEKLPRYL